jgi:UDP-glucose 4-epimerase
MSNISILGANGYIGQHIAYKLASNGEHKINLFDIHNKGINGSPDYQELDLSKRLSEVVKKKLANSDYIFFFSGLTGTFKSVEKFEDFIDVNEIGLLKVLDFLKDLTNTPKIIFPSTRLVYKGKKDLLLKEEDEKEFKTIYAINKFACEQYLEIFKNLYNIDFTIFRICVPYGNMIGSELSYGTLGHFLNKAKAKENINLYGDGSLKRTFSHVDDLTEILIKGAFNEHTSGEIFNIGGDNLSLLNVAEAIADKYNVKVDFSEFPLVDEIIESGDTIFNGNKILSLLNYTYKHNFSLWINQFNR